MNDREQFLLNRKSGIGGSDIAAIMGLNPWKTAFDVYCDKVTDEITPDNEAMKRGRDLEPLVLSQYARVNNVELETNLPLIRDSEHPYLIGHVDAKVKDANILVEAKTVNGWPSKWKDGIPIYYKTQAAHYASITNCDYVDIPVFFGFEYKQFTYYRDKEFEEKIRESAIDFWNNHVLKGEPPALVNEEDAKRLYHSSNESALEASDDLHSLVVRLIQLEQDKKHIEQDMAQIKFQIMQAMGEHEALTWNDQQLITWKNHSRQDFDNNKFKEDHPKLYEQYLKLTSRRTFRLC